MDEHTSHELAYKKGYEAGKPKWIPVTERKPENDYGKHWKERNRSMHSCRKEKQ